MALSSKVKDGALLVVDSEKMAVAKTATFAKQLKKLDITSALFVGADTLDENFKKSAANINNVDVLPTIGLNVLDILKHEKLVLTADAVKAIEARLGA
jgi:large subunit ribosomal protein L4